MISVNRGAWPLFEAMLRDADALRLGVSDGPNGERLVDAGAAHAGGIAAGLRMAEICMGGLGRAHLVSDATIPRCRDRRRAISAAGDGLPRQPARGMEPEA